MGGRALLAVATALVLLSEWVIAAPVPERVTVTGGVIEGRRESGGLSRYLGIPYAAPPVGVHRWAPPAPVKPWKGVRPAREYGPQCLQPRPLNRFYVTPRGNQSEDCLSLNVWTRATSTDAGLPVIVWIHGGALVEGASGLYPGDVLTQKGVVLVTVNYRLGPLGFFAHPALSAEGGGYSGNQGYRDQLAALHWVRNNIRAFGGDPDNVTVAGESAGAWGVNVLQASPLARGLFHKAIGQSGARFLPLPELRRDRPWAKSAEARGIELAQQWTGRRNASLRELREMPGRAIVTIYEANPEELWDFDALTIIDGEVLEEQVHATFAGGRQADVPVLLGSNEDEASTFDTDMLDPVTAAGLEYRKRLEAVIEAVLPELNPVLRDALYPTDDRLTARESYIRFQTDVFFTQPIRRWARLMANVRSEAYLYWWNWQPAVRFSGNERRPAPGPSRELDPMPGEDQAGHCSTDNLIDFGAFHAAEIPYLFGKLDENTSFGFTIEDLPRERRFSELMMTLWSEFARSGVPTAPDLPAWPAFTPENPVLMVLGRDLYVARAVRQREVEAIEAAYDRRRGKVE